MQVPAQTPHAAPGNPSVLMLSDIHFDPFHVPAKFAALREAPAEKWAGILAAPGSAGMAAAFAQLQAGCHTRGVDTPFPLLQDSLMVAHTRVPHPLFVTVSGDLMAHAFDCRFHALAPKASESEYSAFAAKTVAFVTLELRERFPGTPIYLALGNNDSGCTDYRETPGSAFLAADAQAFADAVVSPANRASILETFSDLGDYTVQLPAPMARTRLIVLQDIFESKKFAGCPGAAAANAGDAAARQIAWLRETLTQAREQHERVWVMGHIPPGIDPYTTFRNGIDVCSGKAPVLFLGSEALTDTLADFPDVIRLALFAHTHMDEFRVIRKPGSSGEVEASEQVVPAKLVPSISPVDGNDPAFTVAEVAPGSGTVKDYKVYAASSQAATGWMEPPVWREEYRYSTAYQLPDFSAASAARLAARFVGDKTGSGASAQAFEQNYYVNDGNLSAAMKTAALQFVWPQYACAIANTSVAGYRRCACPAKPAAETPAQP
jgi:sphingomyelin phosphodiesterase acid-like 3